MVTSITTGAYSAEALRTRLNAERFVDLKSQMEDLQRQLSTGKLSDDWAGLGPGRLAALDFRSTLSTLDGYDENIQNAQTRLKLMDQAMTQLDKSRSTAVSSLVSDSILPSSGMTRQSQLLLTGRFNETIDLLNTDVAGRFAFSGRSTDKRPVVSSDLILNGGGGKIGLIQAIANRRTADQVTGTGGLTTPITGNTVTVTAGSGGFGVSGTNTFDFTTPPTDGQVFKLTLTLPDGSTETLSLTAKTSGPATAGSTFLIDPNPATTALNFKTSLDQALTTAASTALAAASAMRASTDFFAGTIPNTVQWYVGDNAADPRATALVRASDGAPTETGAQANEAPFQRLMASYGAMAAETFSSSDPYADQRYQALRSRLAGQLGEPAAPRIADIATELGFASADLNRAAERNKTSKAIISDQVGAIEDATPEQVAASLLSLQTQLQASYQTASMVSKLSLVNYL